MKNVGHFNFIKFLFIISSIALLVGIFRPAIAASLTGSPSASADTWYGLYTDATSYEPGDAIQIYSSAPDIKTVFRLVRLGTDWTEAARTDPVSVGPQSSGVGSFIEYPTLPLSNRISFTLEGWYHPTLLGGDTAVVAGQIGLTESAAGIVIIPDGRMAAYVSDTPPTDQGNLAIAPAPANFDNWLDSWHHLALTYDGTQIRLYIDGVIAAQRAQTGPVAQVAAPFRLGARSEAPGDLTGVIDGRLDSWALWPTALSAADIEARRQRGLAEDDPAPDPADVDLYLGFEGPYPSTDDGSNNGHIGVVTNHGNPGMTGVTGDGRGFRLNHDQIVDAGWSVTAELTIPPGTESGMYAVQALLGPDFTPTQEGNLLSVRAFAVRPAAAGPRAPIAVVMPTNTWLAYNHWPQGYNQYLAGPGITPRSRYPGGTTKQGGNNSAYANMGDHVSLALYHGSHRPSDQMSPVERGDGIANYSVRAPNSMYMVQWLDAQGFDYDVFSDDDFSAGIISASDYRVLMPHSHHEYWTDGMLASLTQFLDDGGSVAAPAGNIFTWRTVYNDDWVMEVRKFSKMEILGLADLQGGIDGQFMGTLRQAAACNLSGDSYQEIGVAIHLTSPCSNKPFCFGQWEAQNIGHWLWQGSGMSDLDHFGIGRPSTAITPTFAVGHEADTWLQGMPIPGLSPGQEPVILAEGTNFDPLGNGDSGGVNGLLDAIGVEPTCDNVKNLIGEPVTPSNRPPATRAGTILYFPHSGGGHVLVIGASATPWALESDAALSGLLYRALMCFGYDEGCGYDIYLPAILR